MPKAATVKVVGKLSKVVAGMAFCACLDEGLEYNSAACSLPGERK